MSSLFFEDENRRAYVLLLRIEVALREVIRLALYDDFGPQWHKRLGGDLLRKIREAQRDESKPQFDYVRLGPLYYLTFGELLSQLNQKPCQALRQRLGGEVIIKQLENILSPRNAVCHSRPASSVGLNAIESLYSQLETCLTPDGLAALIASPDTGLSQAEFARHLTSALHLALQELPNLPIQLTLPSVVQIAKSQFWWGEDDFAGFATAPVEATLTAMERYNDIPKGVGAAGERYHICEQYKLEDRIRNAISVLAKVQV